MNALDYVFLGILVIFTLRGFIRGLINEVFGIGSLIFPLFISLLFYKNAAVLISSSVSMNPILAKILGFLAVFVTVFIAVKLLQLLLKAIFSGKILGSLDKTLGLLLGFIEGAALVFVVLFIMGEANPAFNSQEIRDGSFIANIVNEIPV